MEEDSGQWGPGIQSQASLGSCVCSGAFWNWWVGAAVCCNVVAQGSSETPWPEVGTLGCPGNLHSLHLAGEVTGCGLA